jgi:hypothetical protein
MTDFAAVDEFGGIRRHHEIVAAGTVSEPGHDKRQRSVRVAAMEMHDLFLLLVPLPDATLTGPTWRVNDHFVKLW